MHLYPTKLQKYSQKLKITTDGNARCQQLKPSITLELYCSCCHFFPAQELHLALVETVCRQ